MSPRRASASLGWLVAAAASCASLVLLGTGARSAASARGAERANGTELVWGGEGARPLDETRFPHAKHAKLFPTCLGCHGGVLADDSTRGERPPLTPGVEGRTATALFPSEAQCTVCHDGKAEKRVEWDGPRPAPSNLRFSHAVHDREWKPESPEQYCTSCHAIPGDTTFMAVARARPERCIACHDHRAPTHLAEAAKCETCHVPLTRAVALSVARVREFPRPPSHLEPVFAAQHAVSIERTRTQCAVCHARESCERCHANGARVAQIMALGQDARVATIVASLPAPSYPVPASHERGNFGYSHGSAARAAPQKCANCHTQPSCTTCHTGALASAVIAELPPGDPRRGVRLMAPDPWWTPSARGTATPALLLQGSARGGGDTLRPARSDTLRVKARDSTRLAAREPVQVVRVHPPGFSVRHGPAAATNRTSCSGCHEPSRFCTNCHDGEGRRRFHPTNFVARHPADAYARQRECTACHSTEAFCGACHKTLGLQSKGGFTVAYHDAQQLWLLQHGRAARMGMASCVTCHQEKDCTRCHAQTGFGVNPHGPGFNARGMAKRNAPMCRVCHISDPLARQP